MGFLATFCSVLGPTGEGGRDFDKLSESDKGVGESSFGDVGWGETTAGVTTATAASGGWFLRWGSMDLDEEVVL